MKALLVVAHGSRRQASNDEIRQVTEKIAQKAGDSFGDVRCAFLELAEPSIPDGIGECVNAGADEVIVLPYFLSAGRHVAEDIPAEIDKKKAELPDVKIRNITYVGALNGMIDLMLEATRCSCDDFRACQDCPARS